jgi:hypothetical protein
MPRQDSERLTRREREIMYAIFALANRASAQDIRARMTSPPSDSSVRVILARLEKNGRDPAVLDLIPIGGETIEVEKPDAN